MHKAIVFALFALYSFSLTPAVCRGGGIDLLGIRNRELPDVLKKIRNIILHPWSLWPGGNKEYLPASKNYRIVPNSLGRVIAGDQIFDIHRDTIGMMSKGSWAGRPYATSPAGEDKHEFNAGLASILSFCYFADYTAGKLNSEHSGCRKLVRPSEDEYSTYRLKALQFYDSAKGDAEIAVLAPYRIGYYSDDNFDLRRRVYPRIASAACETKYGEGESMMSYIVNGIKRDDRQSSLLKFRAGGVFNNSGKYGAFAPDRNEDGRNCTDKADKPDDEQVFERIVIAYKIRECLAEPVDVDGNPVDGLNIKAYAIFVIDPDMGLGKQILDHYDDYQYALLYFPENGQAFCIEDEYRRDLDYSIGDLPSGLLLGKEQMHEYNMD